MKKTALTILIANFLIACDNKPISGSNDFVIEDAENISGNLLTPFDHERMHTKPYFEGKLKIISIPGEWVITGLDSNSDN